MAQLDDVIRFYPESGSYYYDFTPYSLLSVKVDNDIYRTLNHYYQAMRIGRSRLCMTDYPAKDVSELAHSFLQERGITFTSNEKESIMMIGLEAKFDQHPYLKDKLIATGTKQLIFHHPTDSFWGTGGVELRGYNMLGELLMQIRRNITRPITPSKSIEDQRQVSPQKKSLQPKKDAVNPLTKSSESLRPPKIFPKPNNTKPRSTHPINKDVSFDLNDVHPLPMNSDTYRRESIGDHKLNSNANNTGAEHNTLLQTVTKDNFNKVNDVQVLPNNSHARCRKSIGDRGVNSKLTNYVRVKQSILPSNTKDVVHLLPTSFESLGDSKVSLIPDYDKKKSSQPIIKDFCFNLNDVHLLPKDSNTYRRESIGEVISKDAVHPLLNSSESIGEKVVLRLDYIKPKSADKIDKAFSNLDGVQLQSKNSDAFRKESDGDHSLISKPIYQREKESILLSPVNTDVSLNLIDVHPLPMNSDTYRRESIGDRKLNSNANNTGAEHNTLLQTVTKVAPRKKISWITYLILLQAVFNIFIFIIFYIYYR